VTRQVDPLTARSVSPVLAAIRKLPAASKYRMAANMESHSFYFRDKLLASEANY
jgi:hypothetical protein